MPIKGLTTQPPSFPQLGTLKKGEEKTENKPGKNLGDTFRFIPLTPAIGQAFEENVDPAEIHCYLPYSTTDENFSCWVEKWGKTGLDWRGDGETLVMWRTPAGLMSKEPRPQPSDGGNPVGRLSIIIPELGRLGYVCVLTHSIWDIKQLTENLRAYEAMFGKLTSIPFVLRRVTKNISYPLPSGGGKRGRRDEWLISIEPHPDWVQDTLRAMSTASGVLAEKRLTSGISLPAGGDNNDDGGDEMLSPVLDITLEQPKLQPSQSSQSSKPTPYQIREELKVRLKEAKKNYGLTVAFLREQAWEKYRKKNSDDLGIDEFREFVAYIEGIAPQQAALADDEDVIPY